MKNPKIYTYTVVHVSSVEFRDRVPYACAIIQDDEGARASCILEGYTPGVPIAINLPVRELAPDGEGPPRFSL